MRLRWTKWVSAAALLALAAPASAQFGAAARKGGQAATAFDGGFGHAVYPLSDEKLCPGGATHFYSYSREFSIAGDMVFTCMVDARNANYFQFVVYDQGFVLRFKDAVSAAGLGSMGPENFATPQFSMERRVLFARNGTRIYELDPWNRKNRLVVNFGGTPFTLRDGRTLRAGQARDFKVGPGDSLVMEMGVARRVLVPGARDCPDCFEVLGIAVFDPASGKIHTYVTRDDPRMPRWPKVATSGFDEANLTQDNPARVFATYENRPAWSFALDFTDAVEFRQASYPPYGDRKYQWSAHGHPGFFCGSNARCYVVRPLGDIIDDDLDGIPDRVGSVGTTVNGKWRGLFHLTNSRTGAVELVWGAQNPERQFSGAHFSRSLRKDVFFGSSARHEGNTITRYLVRYDAAGKPVEVLGENLAYSNSEIRCGYWAHPRATGSDDGMRAMFDSTLAGKCKSQVYVVVANTPPGQAAVSADKP